MLVRSPPLTTAACLPHSCSATPPPPSRLTMLLCSADVTGCCCCLRVLSKLGVWQQVLAVLLKAAVSCVKRLQIPIGLQSTFLQQLDEDGQCDSP